MFSLELKDSSIHPYLLDTHLLPPQSNPGQPVKLQVEALLIEKEDSMPDCCSASDSECVYVKFVKYVVKFPIKMRRSVLHCMSEKG